MLIARDWDILRANGHLRWTRLKTFYKININCFFRKKSPSGLNLTSNFGPNSDKMVKIKNFYKSCSNRAYFVQKNLLIIFPKSVLVYSLPPTQKLAKFFSVQYYFVKIKVFFFCSILCKKNLFLQNSIEQKKKILFLFLQNSIEQKKNFLFLFLQNSIEQIWKIKKKNLLNSK